MSVPPMAHRSGAPPHEFLEYVSQPSWPWILVLAGAIAAGASLLRGLVLRRRHQNLSTHGATDSWRRIVASPLPPVGGEALRSELRRRADALKQLLVASGDLPYPGADWSQLGAAWTTQLAALQQALFRAEPPSPQQADDLARTLRVVAQTLAPGEPP